MKKEYYLILFMLLPIFLFGQKNVIDSLKTELEKANEKNEAHILNEIAFNYLLVNEISKALDFSERALEKAKINKQKDEEGLAMKNTASVYRYTNQANKAFETYNKAIKIFEQTKNYRQIIRVYHNLSNLYLQTGEFSKMYDFLIKAREYSRKYDIISIPLLGSLSNFYQLVGMYDKSLEYILKSLKHAEKQNDKEGIAYAYNSMAKIYLHNNQTEKAKKAYLKSIKIYAELEQKNHVAALYNNLGAIYGKTNEYEKALDYCKKSLEIKEKSNYTEGILFSLLTMGDLYFETKKYEKAEEYYKKGIKSASEKNILHLLSLFQNKIGILYFVTGKKNKAYKQLNESNKIALKNKSLELINSNYLYLAKIDSAKANYKKAFLNYVKYSKTNDSLYSKAKSRQIEEMKIRFETEKKEQKILRLESEKKVTEKERNIQRLQKNIAIAGIILSLIFIILIFNRLRIRKKLYEQKEQLIIAKKEEVKLQLENEKLAKKQLIAEQQLKEEELKAQAEINAVRAEKLHAELEHKKRELSSSALFVYQKNDILSDINKKVEALEQNAKSENLKSLRNIKKLIKDNRNLDKDWNDFKLHFESVHPSFFTKIKADFPSVTNNELKHCSYMKVKLSSKEIARIMNITPKSVQVSRYRLKKKFLLGAKDNLFDFIENI